MNISVIGTGYVGLVTGTCLAEMGNQVYCVDQDQAKVDQLINGGLPIYEPGLEELIHTNVHEGRLTFTTDLDQAVKNSIVCLVAVGTPQGDNGACDLEAVFSVVKAIARAMDGYRVVVMKSTVPVGTCDQVEALLKSLTTHPFAVVSNPEFLKQGAAVSDFLNPDRVVVGVSDPRAADIMREIYAPFLRTGNPMLFIQPRSAEMTKYVANAFLATKISFMNEMSQLSERLGADIEEVRVGIASDTRIGKQFLFPGIGFGGSCFPKDIRALIHTAHETGFRCSIIEAVDRVNSFVRTDFARRVKEHFGGHLRGRQLAVWGLSFKPGTDDMRDAPSITIVEDLLQAGASVKAFDPKAMERARTVFGDRIEYATSAYGCLEGADALLLLTEWNEFRRPDWVKMKKLMARPVIFDGRNQFEPERMAQRGFEYLCMGRAAAREAATASASPR